MANEQIRLDSMNRKYQKTVFFSALAILCFVSFVAGRMSSTSGSKSPATPTPDGGAHAGPIMRGDVNGDGPGLRDRSRAQSRISSYGTVGSRRAIERMESIMTKRVPLARTAAWLEFVSSLDPDQIRDMLDYLHAKGEVHTCRPEYLMLFDAWIELNPRAAIEYADAKVKGKADKQALLTAWANKDLKAAMRWAQEKDKGEDLKYRMLAIIKGIGSSDPELATRILNELPVDATTHSALKPLANQYLGQEVEEARDWCLRIKQDKLRASAIAHVSLEQSRVDPQGAADWLLVTMPEGGRAITDVMSVMTRSDAQTAIDYLNTINNPSAQRHALVGIARELSTVDPHAALALMDSNSSIVSDAAWRNFTYGAVMKEPELAANTISRFQDITARDLQYRRILSNWLRKDYDAAIAWINQNDLSAEVREDLDRTIEYIRKTKR